MVLTDHALNTEVRAANKSADELRRAGTGTRVETTTKAIASGVVRAKKYGVITGFGRHHWTVIVRKDGNKTASAYHVTFWRRSKQPPSVDAVDPHAGSTGTLTTRDNSSSGRGRA